MNNDLLEVSKHLLAGILAGGGRPYERIAAQHAVKYAKALMEEVEKDRAAGSPVLGSGFPKFGRFTDCGGLVTVFFSEENSLWLDAEERADNWTKFWTYPEATEVSSYGDISEEEFRRVLKEHGRELPEGLN